MTELVPAGRLVEALEGTIRQCVLVGRVESLVGREKLVRLGGGVQMAQVVTVSIGLPVLLHLDTRFFMQGEDLVVDEVVVVDAVLRPSPKEGNRVEAVPLTVARWVRFQEPTLDGEGRAAGDGIRVTRGMELWKDRASWQFEVGGLSEALVFISPNLR